ncbi:MAG: GNAT family N-acetyltransferase, partial [Magnetococcales bacterium]|nr:GNAT family N-acetyltransferase [Magnetococcales bacterium]
ALMEGYRRLLGERGCIAATLIASPLDPDHDQLKSLLQPDFIDSRRGLITPLPEAGEDDESALMERFHGKSRNMVRKALQGGFRLDREESPENWAFLERTHRDNMNALGAACHPPAYFEALRLPLEPKLERRLLIACLDDQPVAGLLLYLFGKTVEYAIPVIEASHRGGQPLTFLIWHAMLEAIDEGYRLWNWGGTGWSQESLYRFKKRLGAVDHPYYYFTHLFDRSLLTRDRGELMRNYPYFFAYPFNLTDCQPLCKLRIPLAHPTE